jgi:hypothetical protein
MVSSMSRRSRSLLAWFVKHGQEAWSGSITSTLALRAPDRVGGLYGIDAVISVQMVMRRRE